MKSPIDLHLFEEQDPKPQSLLRRLNAVIERLVFCYRYLRADVKAVEDGKVTLTSIGGIAIKMKNGTGSNSVKGSLVSASTTEDNKFVLQSNEFDTFGIVYEDGKEDDTDCLIVVSGIAQVLFKAATASIRGYVAIAADDNGRADNIAVPSVSPAAAEHFKEIGHVLESKGGGSDVLVKCVLHFN